MGWNQNVTYTIGIFFNQLSIEFYRTEFGVLQTKLWPKECNMFSCDGQKHFNALKKNTIWVLLQKWVTLKF